MTFPPLWEGTGLTKGGRLHGGGGGAWRNRNGGVKTAAWRTFMRRRRRPTLHHAVKDKRVTVLGPVKQPEMDFMSHRGGQSTNNTSV